MVKILRQQIVDQARTYLNTRYVRLGRDKHGLDCWGLIYRVCHDVGYPVIDSKSYLDVVNPMTDSPHILDELNQRFKRKRIKDATLGDVLLFRIEGRRHSHVAIVSDKGIIHAYLPGRRVVENGIGVWVQQISACFEIPGVI
jgi:cell wall-associated NlpC family hydrolase